MPWADDNPFFLLVTSGEEHQVIDLGESGWSKTYAEWMRRPGDWYLCRKSDSQVMLAMIVYPGEQPYYTKRHFGQIASGGQRSRETSSYGIGKKRLDGHVDRLWLLPDGVAVCGGDDVDELAMRVVRTLAWQEQQPME